jgi:threonine dehydratase
MTQFTELTQAMIYDAYSKICSGIARTPAIRASDLFDAQSPIIKLLALTFRECSSEENLELFFKCENLQKSGSFKFRGAMHSLRNKPDEALKGGIISYSTGKD